MINSGLPILRGARDPRRADDAQAAVGDARSMPYRRRAGLVALGRDAEAPEGLQRPLRLDGEVGRDGRLARLHPAQARRDARARGALRGKIKSAMTYPVAGRGPRRPDHGRDAAVRRAAVQGHLRAARWHAAACRPAYCCSCRTCSRSTGGWSSRCRSSRRFALRRYKATEKGAPRSTAEAAGPVFGCLFHKTALSPVLQHARDAALGRACRSCRRSTSCRTP